MTGRKFGRYEVIDELGAGGMGVVYRARDTRLDRTVAVKVLPPSIANETARRRFLLEARSAGALSHPNIVAVYDAGEADGSDFLVMELVRGRPLSEVLAEGPVPVAHAVHIATQIASGLMAAHAVGLLHRDLKPGNIMLSEDNTAKILDFGLAKRFDTDENDLETGRTSDALTGQGLVVGTILYMSPEQAQGRPVGPLSDLFSLGILLYEMLTGTHPFAAPSPMATVAAILTREAPPVELPGVPAALAEIVARSLNKDPRDRFQTAEDLRAALEVVMQGPADLPTVAALPRLDDSRRTVEGIAPSSSVRRSSGTMEVSASIAVLPFEALGSNTEDAYFAEGLTEEINGALARLRELRVASRTSVSSLRGEHLDPRKIGARLEVGSIVEGTIRRAGDRLRVTARLVHVHDGFQVWSERYDRGVDDVFTIQEDVARNIASKLHVSLGSDAVLSRRFEVDPKAYGLYLKGRYHWARRTGDSIQIALASYKECVAIDPDFALGYTGLAECTGGFAWYGIIPPGQATETLQGLLAKAQALGADLAEVQATVAFFKASLLWEWESAEAHYLRALEIDPSYAQAQMHYAMQLLIPLGRLDEAEAISRYLLDTHPLVPMHHAMAGILALWRGDNEGAIAHTAESLRLDPELPIAGMINGQALERRGEWDQALEVLSRAARRLPPGAFLGRGLLGHAMARSGDTAGAEAMLAELMSLRDRTYVQPITLAAIHAGLGDPDAAFAALDAGVAEHCQGLTWMRGDPTWDGLRSDPRFQAVLDAIVPA